MLRNKPYIERDKALAEKHLVTLFEIFKAMRKKPYIERDKALAEKRLVALFEILKSKGLTDMQIQRDPIVRHFRGEIRRLKCRLANIAQLEELMARKAEVKAEKLATPKVHLHLQKTQNQKANQAKSPTLQTLKRVKRSI